MRKLRTALVAAASLLLVGGGAAAATGASAGGPGVPVSPSAAMPASRDWTGIARQPVTIPMDGGWTAAGELTYPRHSRGPLPTVVLIHGSGRNDLDQTLPGPDGRKVSTFRPLAQALTRAGFAVLRFNKRGVVGAGPQLSDDPRFLDLAEPYTRYRDDAASVVRFAAAADRVDRRRIFLVGHSEGTMIAANLAARPADYGIPAPAGVALLGSVGLSFRAIITYQLYGRSVAQLREEIDVDGDGFLTAPEVVDGLAGRSAEEAADLRAQLLTGDRVSTRLDTDRDGRLSLADEVAPFVRAASGVDDFPDLPDESLARYARDVSRYPNVAEDLPRYAGPSLVLHGENDVQTPLRGAYVIDAALTAAGRTDHRLVVYPGLGHAMNRTLKFTTAFGDPDPRVVSDLSQWLRGRAGS